MKKILVFLIVFLLLGMNTVSHDVHYLTKKPGCQFGGMAFAAPNVMTADVYYFTIADEIAPYISNISPASGSTINPNGFTLSFDVQDNESGVAPIGAVVMLNGVEQPGVLTIIDKGYHVEVPISGLAWGTRIDIRIEVSDNAQ